MREVVFVCTSVDEQISYGTAPRSLIAGGDAGARMRDVFALEKTNALLSVHRRRMAQMDASSLDNSGMLVMRQRKRCKRGRTAGEMDRLIHRVRDSSS